MLLRHGTNAAWCLDMDGHVVAGQQAKPWAEVIPWKELGSVLGSFGPCSLLVQRPRMPGLFISGTSRA